MGIDIIWITINIILQTTHWNWSSVKACDVTIKYTDFPVEGKQVEGWGLPDFAGSAMDINVIISFKSFT